MLKKQLLPSNADQALVESWLLVQSKIGVPNKKLPTAIVEKIFNALSYRIVSCSTVIEDQTAQSTCFYLLIHFCTKAKEFHEINSQMSACDKFMFSKVEQICVELTLLTFRQLQGIQ